MKKTESPQDTVPDGAERPPPNGRRADGRFAAGNRHGKGNTRGRRLGSLRDALREAVTADDLTRVVRRLVERAARGDVSAARVILERCLRTPRPEPVRLSLPAAAGSSLEAAIRALLQELASGRLDLDSGAVGARTLAFLAAALRGDRFDDLTEVDADQRYL